MLWCDSFAFFYCFFVNLCLLIPFFCLLHAYGEGGSANNFYVTL